MPTQFNHIQKYINETNTFAFYVLNPFPLYKYYKKQRDETSSHPSPFITSCYKYLFHTRVFLKRNHYRAWSMCSAVYKTNTNNHKYNNTKQRCVRYEYKFTTKKLYYIQTQPETFLYILLCLFVQILYYENERTNANNSCSSTSWYGTQKKDKEIQRNKKHWI